MKRTLLLIICILPYTLPAQTIMEIKKDTLYSEAYGQERPFRIAFPTDMPSDTEYNLLFVLDADYVFDIVASAAIYLQTFDYIPPTAVVAVDYSIPGLRDEVGFSMNTLGLNAAGIRFYNYLNDELLPYVSSNFNASGFNTLVGHSYTATYLLYYLSQCNKKFSSYILFTPEHTDLKPINDQLCENNDNRPIIRIITASEDTDDRIAFGQSLYETLLERQYNAETHVVAADHMSVIPSGISLALESLYDEYRNIDWLWENPSVQDMSVWDYFTETGQFNEAHYRQPLRVSAGYINFFLRAAMEKKDSESLERLIDYYGKAMEAEHPEANALVAFGDLLRRMGKYEKADKYFQRGIDAYDSSNRRHETWYWRQAYALYVLPALNRCDEAWNILEECKGIFKNDKVAFDYYQGRLAVENDFRLADGIMALQRALDFPDILCENFISPEDAEVLLKKAIEKTDFLQESLEKPENP